jgi:hypothetical protein
LSIAEDASCFGSTIRQFFQLTGVVLVGSRIEYCISALLLAHLQSSIVDINRNNLASSGFRYLSCSLAWNDDQY